jgi:hypothetical protein
MWPASFSASNLPGIYQTPRQPTATSHWGKKANFREVDFLTSNVAGKG